MFAGVNISVGESVQGSIVAQVQVGGGEVWANAMTPQQIEAAAKGSWVAQSDKDDIWKSFLSLLNGITNIFFALLTPLLMLAGWLLTPDWVFGEIFGLRPILHDLWVLVSNVVYVIFAFLLVVMAFMNIFAGEKNTWAIKAKLPKLIVGVISVPFTWFFVSAVVSISSVLTASAIQLAGDLVPTDAQATFMAPKECTINFEGKKTPGGANLWIGSDGSFSSCTKSEPRKLSEFLKSKDAYGIVSYYAYGVFQVQDLKRITGPNLETAKTILDLGVGVLMALIIFIIFLLIIIALVIAMMMRAFYFWAIAIFSPLLSLRYFFDGKLGFGDDWLSVGSIIGLAMVPVYVAAALSLGLVFISAASSTDLTVKKSDYVTEVTMTPEKQEITVLGTKFIVLGTPVWANTATDIKTLGGGFIGGLLIKIAALCILWFAVMAALKGSKITQEAAEPISKFGGEIGGLLKKLPQYAPIIPTGHGKASLNNLSSLSSGISNAVTTQWNAEANETGRRLAESMGFAGDKITTAMQQAAAKFNPNTLNNVQAGESINAITKASGAKTVDEFVRMTATSKNVIANHIGNLNVLDKTKREEIAKLLKTGNAAEVTRAYHQLDDLLGWSVGWQGKDVQNSQISVNEYMAGLQASNTASASAVKLVWGNIPNIASTNVELKITVEANGNIEFPNQKQLKDAIISGQNPLPNSQAKEDYKKARLSEIRTALEAKNIPKANIDKLIWEL
jgi:hypothetical protein